jgi:hypothetical protein
MHAQQKRPVLVSLWVCLALIFDFMLYLFAGPEKAMMFLCGFVIEKA